MFSKQKLFAILIVLQFTNSCANRQFNESETAGTQNESISYSDSPYDDLLQLCENIKKLSKAQQETVAAMIIVANKNINSCKSFASVLSKYTTFDLSNSGKTELRDLSPLATMTQLVNLKISGYLSLADFSVLYRLENLVSLDLSENGLFSVPAASNGVKSSNLKKLKTLNLSGNRIQNLEGIAGIVNLEELFLSRNRISEIPKLLDLSFLRHLRLDANQITQVESLVGLKSLRELDLKDNQNLREDEINVLKSLPALKTMDLRGTRAKRGFCPISASRGSCLL